ncbi:MAG TPA: TIGR03936 family radical SAM-associated protein [Candidatus Limnocylindria bacterium]|nr:TIGR03936 family radical SAM-associated protein [Candidatus Limnocylindria bacterium]
MTARTPDGPPPPPTVQRLRIRYAKRGRLRFTSHRDFARSFERSLRRAAVPMAYSAGFSPHPKISYANAAPTGTASDAEYLEIGVAERCDPGLVLARLDEALPAGLDIIEVVEAAPGALADLLEASRWEIRLPALAASDVRCAVEAFLAADEVLVERLTKNGLRSFDARGPVLTAEVRDPAEAADAADEERPCAILDLVVRHVTPSVRPDDVLSALLRVADLAPPVPPLVTRLAQGPLDAATCTVGDPLAPVPT